MTISEDPVSDAYFDGRLGSVEELVAAGAKLTPENSAYVLCDAIDHGGQRMVELLLEAGADPNASEESFESTPPLKMAIARHQSGIVELLLSAGADVAAVVSTEEAETTICGATVPWLTLLHILAKRNDKENLEALLAKGANANVLSREYGATPLYVACSEGHREAAEALLAHGADVNLSGAFHGSTPLHISAQLGHTEIAELLIAAGSNLDHADSGGSTPLLGAILHGKKETAQLLLAAGADFTKCTCDGKTLLHRASESGSRDLAELVLGLLPGTTAQVVNKADSRGATPLYLAALHAHSDVAAFLIASGADVDAPDSDGETPLGCACELGGYCITSNHRDVAEVLLGAGADFNKVFADAKDGSTALHWASRVGLLGIVRSLLKSSGVPDVDQCDAKGRTPLHWASEKGQRGAVELLMAAGAQVDALDDSGWSPFMRAALGGRTEVCLVLLEAGADLNRADEHGRTALELSIHNNNIETALVLMRRDPSVLVPFLGRLDRWTLESLRMMLEPDESDDDDDDDDDDEDEEEEEEKTEEPGFLTNEDIIAKCDSALHALKKKKGWNDIPYWTYEIEA